MIVTYLTHITLNTGHQTRQQRQDTDDAGIAAISALLDSALTGGRPAIPGHPGYHVSAVAASRYVLVATIWSDPPVSVPLVTSGVALKSRPAPRLWREMAKFCDGQVAAKPPPAPWIADVTFMAADHINAFRWTGEITRLIGLAWLEYSK